MEAADRFCGTCGTPRAASESVQITEVVAEPHAVSSPAPRAKRKWVIPLAVVAVLAAIVGVAIALTSSDDTKSVDDVPNESVDSSEPADGASTSVESTAGVSAPETTAASTTSTVSVSAIPTTSTSTTTTSPPPATTPSGLPVRFPSTVPPGKCSSPVIARDTGNTLLFDASCNGAWSFNLGSECETDCEAADVYRWTGDRWTFRGTYYSMCATSLTESGMPPAVARTITGDVEDYCAKYVDLVSEPSSGPLQFNDEGRRVAALQRALIARGLLFDDADGEYGPNTEAAVRDLQFFLGIDADGVAGLEVHSELGVAYP